MNSKALQFTFNMPPILKTILGSLGVIAAMAAAIFSLVQLIDTKRVMSLNSFMAIKEGYSAPKMQFYSWMSNLAMVWDLDDQKREPKNKDYIKFLTRMYAIEYLRSIEFVCNAYLQGLLGDEARQFVESYVKGDIEFLVIFYAKEGMIQLGDDDEDVSVWWIKPGNDDPGDDESESFPSTLKCVTLWGIDLKETSFF